MSDWGAKNKIPSNYGPHKCRMSREKWGKFVCYVFYNVSAFILPQIVLGYTELWVLNLDNLKIAVSHENSSVEQTINS